MKNLFAKFIGWLPVFLLLIVAAHHFFLVSSQHLSPWLGGGFGMFASTDVGSSRRLIVTAINVKDDKLPIKLVGNLDELRLRARGLPNPNQLNALAQATWKELKKESNEDKELPLSSLRIEVWRTHYDAKSLQPKPIQIVLKDFDFEHKKN